MGTRCFLIFDEREGRWRMPTHYDSTRTEGECSRRVVLFPLSLSVSPFSLDICILLAPLRLNS